MGLAKAIQGSKIASKLMNSDIVVVVVDAVGVEMTSFYDRQMKR